ncbi:MAG: hypothetical protein A2Y17_12310 [Clostridiales bacterium GWF2_38_85]|nr:MAG: hypothetical protein A2Y17_12310 [Clostridiales bacterium GWF2_38_85]
MPLSALGDLLSFAARIEIEQQTRPLWIAHYVISKINGTETIPYEDMLAGVKTTAEPTRTKTPEEIMSDFAPIIAADKMRGG